MAKYSVSPKKPSAKVLVISDNAELTTFFQSQMLLTKFEHAVNVDYRFSSINKNPHSMFEIGSKPINVKDIAIISQIVGQYDLVLSLHCKQIFPKSLVEQVCCINFHPGFNPYNRGWYPQAFSIINKNPVGVTIHLMDAEVDHGYIIDQEEVFIDDIDTSYEVYRKIIEKEKQLIQKNLFAIVEGVFKTFPPPQEGNYNGIDDYNVLCKLDLLSTGTLEEHINLLRATSHGSFKNAYFIDSQGNKCYVKISIEREMS